ncbi:hypothetical protein [Actinoplanes sp. NPDC051859]|uniref:hypothetical protein n=1 Tax=Actinoplanes sp. NPDC051859 TaxID=3363909 RepID=UPI00379FE58C
MANNAETARKTTTIGALTAVLAGLLVVLITSDSLNAGVRYSLGAVVTLAIVVCAYRLRVAVSAGK